MDAERLWEQWRGLAVKLARRFSWTRLGRRLGEREDCEQEALLGLLRAARSYRGGVKFATWAWRVIRCHLISASVDQGLVGLPNLYRERPGLRELAQRALMAGALPADFAERRWAVSGESAVDGRELVARALADLGEVDRQVAVLHLGEGLTLKEIGARLGLTRWQVLWRKRRALARLRRWAA